MFCWYSSVNQATVNELENDMAQVRTIVSFRHMAQYANSLRPLLFSALPLPLLSHVCLCCVQLAAMMSASMPEEVDDAAADRWY
jgi:hypothetical protein